MSVRSLVRLFECILLSEDLGGWWDDEDGGRLAAE